MSGDDDALAEILGARREQIERGHTAESDAAKSAAELARIGYRFVLDAIDTLERGERQNIPVGIRRLARAGGMMIAAIARAREEAKLLNDQARPSQDFIMAIDSLVPGGVK